MKPIARYIGELVGFTVGNGGAGLLLNRATMVPKSRRWSAFACFFVFN
jgi:hypothetical protein